MIYHVVRDGRAPWMLAAYIKIRADTVRGCLRACHSDAYALPDSASGSATSTVVPRPSALSMDSRPPCAAAAPRNCQSKPRSLRLRGVEGFEHPIERTLGYAASGVGDRDRRVSAERDADVYLAASLRSLDTVDQEIEKQLLERMLIANYPDRCREIADGGIRLPLRDFARAPFRSFNQGVYGKGDTIARVRGGAYDRGSRCRQRVTAR